MSFPPGKMILIKLRFAGILLPARFLLLAPAFSETALLCPRIRQSPRNVKLFNKTCQHKVMQKYANKCVSYRLGVPEPTRPILFPVRIFLQELLD